MHCSASISRHSSSASTRGVNTLVPPITNVASVAQNVAMWNSGPQFRYTYVESISASCPIISAWPINAVCDSIAALGRPENAAVYISSTASPESTGDVGIVGRTRRRRTPRTRRCRAGSSAPSPPTVDCDRAARTVVADLGVLVHDDRGRQVVEHERHLLGRLPPVRRAEVRAELGRREQALEQPERVLAEPQDPVAARRRPASRRAFASRLTRSSSSA